MTSDPWLAHLKLARTAELTRVSLGLRMTLLHRELSQSMIMNRDHANRSVHEGPSSSSHDVSPLPRPFPRGLR